MLLSSSPLSLCSLWRGSLSCRVESVASSGPHCGGPILFPYVMEFDDDDSGWAPVISTSSAMVWCIQDWGKVESQYRTISLLSTSISLIFCRSETTSAFPSTFSMVPSFSIVVDLSEYLFRLDSILLRRDSCFATPCLSASIFVFKSAVL